MRRALANVSVSRHFSETEAPNAWQYRVSFRGAGDVAPPESADGLQFNYTAKGSGANADRFRHYQKGGCNPFETDLQNVTARTEVDGRTNPNNCTFSGCVDGVVTRGNLTRFHVGGDDPKGSLSALGDDPLGTSRLQWNAPGEGAGSVKQWLETTSLGRRVVNVSREVYGRHGVVEWRVTFVYNHEQVPPEAAAGGGSRRGNSGGKRSAASTAESILRDARLDPDADEFPSEACHRASHDAWVAVRGATFLNGAEHKAAGAFVVSAAEGSGATLLEASARASIERLRSDYIDLFYLHFPSRKGFDVFGWGSYGSPERYKAKTSDGSMADFERQVKNVKHLLDLGLIKNWGLSNENAYGVTMFCIAADKLGVPRPCCLVPRG